jgi:hypothetical protein
MPEFVEEVDGSRGISRTEHALRSVLNGDIESVRQRLSHALERIGYQVISEEPLYARRRARGWAAYHCSADILEYPIKLTIGLRQLSSNATLATFDYTIEHFGGQSFKGDQQTIKREAEAIMALATPSPTTTFCMACGTKQVNDSRFCRMCGAPNAKGAPAELEVLRLTAGTRAGHHHITMGAIWSAVNLLVILPLILLGYFKGGGLAAVLLLAQAVIGLLLLFLGAYRLHRTLNPDPSQPQMIPVNPPQAVAMRETVDLPLSPAQTYITEGTTELLAPKFKEREKEPVYPKRRDTSPTD